MFCWCRQKNSGRGKSSDRFGGIDFKRKGSELAHQMRPRKTGINHDRYYLAERSHSSIGLVDENDEFSGMASSWGLMVVGHDVCVPYLSSLRDRLPKEECPARPRDA